MPFYEYQCNECGHELEALQKISAAPLTDCPECEKSSLRKKISAAGFRLKGGGWYETDFKSGKKKNIAGDDKGAASDNKSSDSSSKDSSGKDGAGKDSTGKDSKKAKVEKSGSAKKDTSKK